MRSLIESLRNKPKAWWNEFWFGFILIAMVVGFLALLIGLSVAYFEGTL